LEHYLLDCIESLQPAGDDVERRKRALTKSSSWDLLDKNWKAVALLVAERTAPEAIDKENLESATNRGNIDRRTRNRGMRRRGGRQVKRSFEDYLLSPQQVIKSEKSAAFKLTVLIAQKHKMDSWDPSFDEQMDLLRIECSQGIHPVWSRLAREAPVFAELERFDINDEEESNMDSEDWINASHIDPKNNFSIQTWLSREIPLKLTSGQALALEKIRRDLAGKPRPKEWLRIMKGKLRGLENEGALLEAMLLLSADSEEAENVLESIKDSDSMSKIVEKQRRLYHIRKDKKDVIIESLKQPGNDELSRAIKIEGWKRIDKVDQELDLKLLKEGRSILEENEEHFPSALLWRISKLLFENGEYKESREAIEDLSLNDVEEIILAIKIVSKNYSEKLEKTIISAINNSEEEAVVFAMRSEEAPITIQLEGVRILSKLDSIRYTDEILAVLTRTANIEGLAKNMSVDKTLASVYPFRALMIWHLMPAKTGINKMDQIVNLRKEALLALEESEKDDVLSNVSIALISLLGGVSSDMEPIRKMLDSKTTKKLNEVRRALASDGDGIVNITKIESLNDSLMSTEMKELDKRLFSSLIDSLYLNSAAMKLQLGNEEKRTTALQILENLAGKEESTIRTIQEITNLVKEHSIGIESLEKWYRAYDKESAEYQVVRAALEREKGNRLNAARAYKEGALKINNDYEESSLILRQAMIEYAHDGAWKEAVELLKQRPELETLLTQRFQLYLKTCADNASENTGRATDRLIQFVRNEEKNDDGEDNSDYKKRMKESLELIKKYPEEHDLPDGNFRGRVKAALLKLEKSGDSKQSELEKSFKRELDARDIEGLQIVIEQIAEENPLRGIRRYDEAIDTGFFKGRKVERLRGIQRLAFVSQSSNIPIKDRKTLRNLGLKPLILVDTNILIHALKDDLLQEISNDEYGSFDWSVERSFHMMLRRQGGKETFLSIPPAALGEFRHRARNPEAVLNLFNDIYINRKEWKKKITSKFLKERVAQICKSFSTWPQEKYTKNREDVALEDFLIKHEKIFEAVDEQKRRMGDNPPRTEINGKSIYPEKGDRDIMCDAALLASLPLQEIGSILVATRDSDFRLVSRALEEKYGFGVVSDAQQLNSRIR